MSNEIERFICPLTEEIIAEHNCYEICLVAEEVVKESFISKRFTKKEDFKDVCLKYPHHNTD